VATLFSKLLAPDTQVNLAKESADQIAKQLGSKPRSHSQVILGEPFCPYKIPVHLEDFWCTVFVSDTSYILTANHRRPNKTAWDVVDYHVQLKTAKSDKIFKAILLPTTSKAIGIEVFTYYTKWSDAYHKARLTSERLVSIFKKIDFAPISEFKLCPINVRVISSFRFPSDCVEQVQIFRQLMIVVFEEAKERQKSLGSA
jgi:hypothetical protein